MALLTPATERESADMIAAARAAKTTLSLQGGGSRAGLGRPIQTDATLSTRGLTGIVFHEPAELVICARAGTPLAEVEAALAEKGQMLPFEPMDHRAIYGGEGEPTIGGLAACNVSGPRRVRAGAARDSILGLRFVNGMGEIVKSGGRVMKNVTGLDLVKLSCGAHGTLGLLTEVTVKVLPSAFARGTIALDGLDDAKAIEALSLALGSPFEVSGAAHLPGAGLTLIRVEHMASAVDYRCGELTTALAGFGAARRLDPVEADTLWRDVRDARSIAGDTREAVWRIGVAPSRAAGLAASLRDAGAARRWFYDWGGGLVWLTTDLDHVDHVHALTAQAGGHATLMRAPDDVRARSSVFQPPAPAVLALTARVKTSFDPDRVLNPGRMYAGV